MLALLLNLVGAGLLYLASPNQQMLSQPPAAQVLRPAAYGCLLLSLAFWLRQYGPMPAIFVTLTGVMLVWIALPYLSLLRPRPTEPK